jgi:hypothetical protein
LLHAVEYVIHDGKVYVHIANTLKAIGLPHGRSGGFLFCDETITVDVGGRGRIPAFTPCSHLSTLEFKRRPDATALLRRLVSDVTDAARPLLVKLVTDEPKPISPPPFWEDAHQEEEHAFDEAHEEVEHEPDLEKLLEGVSGPEEFIKTAFASLGERFASLFSTHRRDIDAVRERMDATSVMVAELKEGVGAFKVLIEGVSPWLMELKNYRIRQKEIEERLDAITIETKKRHDRLTKIKATPQMEILNEERLQELRDRVNRWVETYYPEKKTEPEERNAAFQNKWKELHRYFKDVTGIDPYHLQKQYSKERKVSAIQAIILAGELSNFIMVINDRPELFDAPVK